MVVLAIVRCRRGGPNHTVSVLGINGQHSHWSGTADTPSQPRQSKLHSTSCIHIIGRQYSEVWMLNKATTTQKGRGKSRGMQRISPQRPVCISNLSQGRQWRCYTCSSQSAPQWLLCSSFLHRAMPSSDLDSRSLQDCVTAKTTRSLHGAVNSLHRVFFSRRGSLSL